MSPSHSRTGLEAVRLVVGRMLSTPSATKRALLYEELASLLQAGIVLRSAISSLAERGSARQRPMTDTWLAQVERGEPLHEGMARRPDVFTALETTLFRIGERSGRLVEALRRLALRLEVSHKTWLKMIGGIAYPVTVLHVALFLPTLPLVLMPYGLGAYAVLVLVGLAVIWGMPAALAFFYIARRADPAFSRRVCKLPIVGAAVHAVAVQRFTWTLGAMHGAGETSDRALEEAASAADAGWFRTRLDAATTGIRKGGELGEAVRGMDAVPRDVCEMVANGERSGSLAESMERASTLYAERGERAARAAAAAAGAAMFILAVIVVVCAVFTVFWRVYGPVFEMTK